ncbi:uncharacterized protein DS421_18g615870 [Arachis hypogaea]|nr:uncharacterized protein DS421_18g615870 [Arachis hypogaea]
MAMKNDKDDDLHCCDEDGDSDPPYCDEDSVERTLSAATKTTLREPSLLQWYDEDGVERTLTSMTKTATA